MDLFQIVQVSGWQWLWCQHMRIRCWLLVWTLHSFFTTTLSSVSPICSNIRSTTMLVTRVISWWQSYLNNSVINWNDFDFFSEWYKKQISGDAVAGSPEHDYVRRVWWFITEWVTQDSSSSTSTFHGTASVFFFMCNVFSDLKSPLKHVVNG